MPLPVQRNPPPVEDLTKALQPVMASGLPVDVTMDDIRLLGLRGVVTRSVDPDSRLSRIKALDDLLRRLLAAYPDDVLAGAAQELFGVAPGSRGATLTERRDRAARAAGRSPDHLRKHIEPDHPAGRLAAEPRQPELHPPRTRHSAAAGDLRRHPVSHVRGCHRQGPQRARGSTLAAVGSRLRAPCRGPEDRAAQAVALPTPPSRQPASVSLRRPSRPGIPKSGPCEFSSSSTSTSTGSASPMVRESSVHGRYCGSPVGTIRAKSEEKLLRAGRRDALFDARPIQRVAEAVTCSSGAANSRSVASIKPPVMPYDEIGRLMCLGGHGDL
jgi:hypothetical protein